MTKDLNGKNRMVENIHMLAPAIRCVFYGTVMLGIRHLRNADTYKYRQVYIYKAG